MLDPNAVTASDGGADGTTSAPFGSNENLEDRPACSVPYQAEETIHAGSLIDDAFAACQAVGGGNGVFNDSWKARLNEVVSPAYRLFVLTHDKPAELARVARLGDIFTTKATEKNPALICVKLAARPSDIDQHKLCSDWSTLLRCALEENIAVDDFIPWVGTTTVGACKKAVAAQQRAAKIAAGLVPEKALKSNRVPDEMPRLELHLHGTDGRTDTAVELPTLMHTSLLDALTAPGSQAERHERMAASLQALAQALIRGEATTGSLTDHEASPVTVEVADD